MLERLAMREWGQTRGAVPTGKVAGECNHLGAWTICEIDGHVLIFL